MVEVAQCPSGVAHLGEELPARAVQLGAARLQPQGVVQGAARPGTVAGFPERPGEVGVGEVGRSRLGQAVEDDGLALVIRFTGGGEQRVQVLDGFFEDRLRHGKAGAAGGR